MLLLALVSFSSILVCMLSDIVRRMVYYYSLDYSYVCAGLYYRM